MPVPLFWNAGTRRSGMAVPFHRNIQLISETDYSSLSDYSIEALTRQEMIISQSLYFIRKAMFITIPLGIFLVVYGSMKWYKVQHYLDSHTKYEALRLESDYKNMTKSEIIDKTSEELEPVDKKHKSSDELSGVIKRSIEIENKVFLYLVDRMSEMYLLNSNMKIGSLSYDVVGISKHNDDDAIYETKYWPESVNQTLFDHTIARIHAQYNNYIKTTKRKCTAVLIVVTKDSNVLKISKLKAHYGSIFYPFKMIILKENDL